MATSRTAAASRGSAKSKKVHGMTTLQSYFSPSPTKKRKQNDKQETKKSSPSEGAPNRRGKRERQSQNMASSSSSKAPLRLLNETNENSRDSKRTKTKHASSSSPTERKDNENRIGLLRIGPVENGSSLTLTASKKDAFLLQEGHLLGRNVSNGRRSSSSNNKKLDLGIGADALGVSRKQLKIIKVQPNSITIHQGKTPNQVGLYRYNAQTKRMNGEIDFVGSDGTSVLRPGDVIEFDTYNRGAERLLDPQHTFRVVTITDTVTIQEDSECQVVDPPKNKATTSSSDKKQATFADQAMEIDSAAANMNSNEATEVFVDCQSTPTDDSFHTAHADSQSTASIPSSTKHPPPTEMATLSTTLIDETPNDRAKKPPKDIVNSELTTESESRDASTPAPESGKTVKYPTKKSSARPRKVQIAEQNNQVREATANDARDTKAISSTKKRTSVAHELESDAKMAARPKETPDDDAITDDAQESDVSPATVFATLGGTPLIRTPVVGDRFRAVYDRQSDIPDNFLGFARPAWYFGTAIKVKKKSRSKRGQPQMYSIDIMFDDKSTDTIEYPTTDTQILTVKGDEAYVEMEDGTRAVAYEGGLEDLAVGDLVESRYQAGSENGAWFRGRVAAVFAAGTCEVAYYDKEYERNIPISRANVCRVEKGRDNLSWLECLKLPSGARIVKFGEIANEDTLFLKLKYSGGRIESKTYDEVIPKIFQHVRRTAAVTKQRIWPALPEEPKKIPKVKTDPIQRRRERRDDEVTKRQDECEPASTRDGVLQDVTAAEISIPPGPELSSSTSTTFSGAIRSTQPEVSAEFLGQFLTSFNSIPSAALTRTLFEIALVGPKQNRTQYPDPHKCELATRFLIESSARNENMKSRLAGYVSTWDSLEDILAQVTEKHYLRATDECSPSNSSLSRISDSLQVVANGLDLLLHVVEYQVKPIVDRTAETGLVRDLPFVKALRGNSGGIREALKFVVRMNAQAWSRYGHFVAGDLKRLYTHDIRPSQAHAHCCEKQARRVMDSFGKLTSYVAWLYAAVEEVRMDTKTFSSVIVDVLTSEFSRSKADVDPYAVEKDKMKKADLSKYWEKVKLEFTLSLVGETQHFAQPMQLKVAELLGIRKKHVILFD